MSADDLDAPAPKRSPLRFDGVITAGNLISLVGMISAVLSGIFYVAIALSQLDERLSAEAITRQKGLENLQMEFVASRSDQAERLTTLSRRIDDSVDAERAVIAQINASLAQISSRLDAAILGLRARPLAPSQN